MMAEGRAIIKNIKETKKRVENLGGVLKGIYSFKDIIFIPISKKINLNEEFIRLRVYKINNWPTKNIILNYKKTFWKNGTKRSKIILKKEFDKKEQAIKFINRYFNKQLRRYFEYSRKGWEYFIGKKRIFVEDIKGFKPSVEIETKDKNELNKIFKQLKIIKKISDTVPKAMEKIKKDKIK